MYRSKVDCWYHEDITEIFCNNFGISSYSCMHPISYNMPVCSHALPLSGFTVFFPRLIKRSSFDPSSKLPHPIYLPRARHASRIPDICNWLLLYRLQLRAIFYLSTFPLGSHNKDYNTLYILWRYNIWKLSQLNYRTLILIHPFNCYENKMVPIPM